MSKSFSKTDRGHSNGKNTFEHNWVQKNFANITILFYSKAEHDTVKISLKKRFDAVLPIPKMQQNHSFTVLSQNKLFIKRYSNALDGFKFVYSD